MIVSFLSTCNVHTCTLYSIIIVHCYNSLHVSLATLVHTVLLGSDSSFTPPQILLSSSKHLPLWQRMGGEEEGVRTEKGRGEDNQWGLQWDNHHEAMLLCRHWEHGPGDATLVPRGEG